MSKIQDRPLPIRRFTLKVFILTTAMLCAIRFLFPTIWRSEVSLGWWLILVIPCMFFFLHVGMAFFEWGFHRYVLHSWGMLEWAFNRPGLRWLFHILEQFNPSHAGHHQRTPISTKEIDPGDGRILLYVSSGYAMERPEQFEASSFPPWSILGFWAFFLIFLIPLHFVFPLFPILICGIPAVAFSYWLYEVTHSIHHYPYAWWKARMSDPRFGKYWRKIFASHHYHHYKWKTNEGVGKVFGVFDIVDQLLRTYHYPKKLLLHQHYVTAEDVAYHDPWPFIVKIDTWVSHREKQYLLKKYAK